MTTAKPFLKWAGGKAQLLPTLTSFFPRELESGHIENYYEPFVGGGAVFFKIIHSYNIKQAFLYDINPELILAYEVIKFHVHDLIKALEYMENEYLHLSVDGRKEYYYHVRDTYNSRSNCTSCSTRDLVQRAAQIIFLNKTCFNGLYRVNKKGLFNVPAGRYKNPTILDMENLLAVSRALKNATLKVGDFETLYDDLQGFSNSFIYYDPPYRPLNQTSSFTAYSNSDFDDKEQKRLAKLFKKLDKLGVKQLLSNSDPHNVDPTDNFFDELYKDYKITRVQAKRMINRDASKRGPINELIITNY